MKQINLKEIKNKMNSKNIHTLITSLGGYVYEENDKHIICSSICHNSSSHKLYWYKDSKQFFCFSQCSRAYSVFDLVIKVKNISFVESIKYICTVCNIPIQDVERYQEKKKQDNWEDNLSKYIKIKRKEGLYKTYDKSILNFFDRSYHKSWIKDGISIETMQKYHIGFYPYKQMITIPVFDKEGNLMGIHGRNLNPGLIELGYKYMPVKMLDGTEYKFSTSQVLYGMNMNQYNIENTKEVNIFEAPKSVLQMETMLSCNNSVGLFGTNISKSKRNLLLNLGIDTVNICLDKQYHHYFDDVANDEEKQEYLRWERIVSKIAQQFKGFCQVYVIYDRGDLLDYKDSPSDKGINTWKILYKNRENIF